MTISKLVEVLDELYDQYRIVTQGNGEVTIYVNGKILTNQAEYFEYVRPAGTIFELKKMSFLQRLFFGKKSVKTP